MSSNVAKASILDHLRFNLFHVIPYLLKGVFTRNKRWMSWLTKLQRDPSSVRFLGKLREKYASDFISLRLLTDRALLVFDPAAIQHILDYSPAIYAETKGKRKGMSHFQPDALTISRGEAWRNRRDFNVSVLQAKGGIHRYANHFLGLIREMITQQNGCAPQNWDGFSKLFETITLQVIFGKTESDTGLMEELKAMMLEANNPLLAGFKSKYLEHFNKGIADRLKSPPDHCLAALCRQTASTDLTKVENQIPHWMFAMADTLAINTVAALALISSHPDTEQTVRDELALYPPVSAENISRLKYLEACIQEAMRLWPTTLMLMREAITDDRIGATLIPQGTQILIHNGFNHRDIKSHSFADRFYPEFWMEKTVDYRFNHLSNGTQACAGKDLALFIAKSVLATLLVGYRYVTESPSLRAQAPLPYAFDHFDVRFHRTPID